MQNLGPQIVELLPKLRRYALALVRDSARADDLVQDTVVKALRSADQFRPGTNLRAWLFSIQYSQFVSGIRRDARRPTAPLDDDMGQVHGGFEDKIVLRELDRAIGRLPANQKAALLLAALEDMSYEEISGVVGAPVGTVRSRISRARDRLRRHFGEAPERASENGSLPVAARAARQPGPEAEAAAR